MILPTKHTTIEQSFLGFGSYILNTIGEGVTVDTLWQKYLTDFHNNSYKAKHGLDNLLLTLVFLFSINAIEENNGEIRRCS